MKVRLVEKKLQGSVLAVFFCELQMCVQIVTKKLTIIVHCELCIVH